MDKLRRSLPEDVLEAKAIKARRKSLIWTVEEIDYLIVSSARMYKELFGDDEDSPFECDPDGCHSPN